MRVLITNNTLDWRAGSELYVRDVAVGLLRRGHQPVAFSTRLGAVAEELRAATIPVVDDLLRLAAPPDLIHGHHHLETTIAMLHFPGVPVVSFCHGWRPWEECPPASPRIRRYVAVDEAGLEKALDRIEAIYRRALETPPFGDARPAAESRSASRYLLFLAPTLKNAWGVAQERDRLAAENREERGARERQVEIQAELARMRATLTWRSRDFLLRSRLVRALHRAAPRLL